jgi:hypothetical protein
MNSTEMGKVLLEVQRLSRSENPLDQVIARETLAKLFYPITSEE